ncbi:hypothetical protein G7046_g9500 [Stylonectria norvegica]|nr:hypothetical protein G7046_g9500 [Stylonectria norvegica]
MQSAGGTDGTTHVDPEIVTAIREDWAGRTVIMATTYPQLVLLGDSLFQGSIESKDGFSFQAALQSHLNRRVDVINRGFSGWNSCHALKYLADIFPERTESSAKMDYLIILIGANDAVIPLPTTCQHVPIEQYKENLTNIVNHPRIRAHKPKILLVTPPPLDEIKTTKLDVAKGHSQSTRTSAISTAYSETARQVAQENPGIVSIDLWQAIMDKASSMAPGDYQAGGPVLGSPENGKQGGLDELLPDGLHMSGEAYKVFYETLLPHVGQEWVGLDEDDPPFEFARAAKSSLSICLAPPLFRRTSKLEPPFVPPRSTYVPHTSHISEASIAFLPQTLTPFFDATNLETENCEPRPFLASIARKRFARPNHPHDFGAASILLDITAREARNTRSIAQLLIVSRTETLVLYNRAAISRSHPPCRETSRSLPGDVATRNTQYAINFYGISLLNQRSVYRPPADKYSPFQRSNKSPRADRCLPAPSPFAFITIRRTLTLARLLVMDPRYSVTREDLYNLQMEVKQFQYTQSSHAERLSRLEKRQADDAALKSVWNSPFPGVLGGTPQQGPVHIPHNEMFDDLDEQGEELLGSLHLGPAEEEPVRRGAASRANSVRFDESALHGSSWGGQNSRHSGDFGPVRPGSSLMMERSLSHKSDGRHSSAGHSVHSHHSVASGRASSLGLDNNFAIVDDDKDSLDIIGPPSSFYVLGTVPSIVRCWLTTNFAHNALLYADVCTGSQRSTVDFSLLSELDLLDDIQRDVDGLLRVRLNVYFAEAVVTHHGSRSGSPKWPVPSITVFFEVTGEEHGSQSAGQNGIRIFIGSDALRAHSADILFSQNTMTLYGDERDRLQVPFVRPEDEAVFRNICTGNLMPEKHKLNAHATPFVIGETGQVARNGDHEAISNSQADDEPQPAASPAVPPEEGNKSVPENDMSEMGTGTQKPSIDANGDSETGSKEGRSGSITSDMARRESSTGIWGSWRHGANNGTDSSPRESGTLSGYQPAGRGPRNMKVLKPQKSGSMSKTGAVYESMPASKTSNEGRRKSLASIGGENGVNGGSRWDTKRTASINAEPKPSSQPLASREVRNAPSLTRSANPVGVASAFSWMTPSAKPKTTTAGMD